MLLSILMSIAIAIGILMGIIMIGLQYVIPTLIVFGIVYFAVFGLWIPMMALIIVAEIVALLAWLFRLFTK